MKYGNVVRGEIVSRPNRFIANVLIDGSPIVAHVKNTGRCKELLLPGAEVYLEKSDNPQRKIDYLFVSPDVEVVSADISGIANKEKFFPSEWINSKGNNVTVDALNYFLPLIQGEPTIEYMNGIPVHFRLNQ